MEMPPNTRNDHCHNCNEYTADQPIPHAANKILIALGTQHTLQFGLTKMVKKPEGARSGVHQHELQFQAESRNKCVYQRCSSLTLGKLPSGYGNNLCVNGSVSRLLASNE